MQRTLKNRPNKNVTPKYYLWTGALVPSALLGPFPTDTEVGLVSQLSTELSSIETLVGFTISRRCPMVGFESR